MDKIIFHDLVKVSELNKKLLTFKDLESFTDSLLNPEIQSDIDITHLKNHGFIFADNIETNIINIDTLVKIMKSWIIRPIECGFTV